jgi:carbohydrate-selective porin OprB
LRLRPQDNLGVAIGRVHVSSLIAERATLYNSQLPMPASPTAKPVSHNEFPAEIHYSVNATQAITVRPNIQLVRASGGVDERTSVVVLGLHLTVQF